VEVAAMSADEIVRVEMNKIERFVALGLGRYEAIQAVEAGIEWRALESLLAERRHPVAGARDVG
jgi:hypothetical protein